MASRHDSGDGDTCPVVPGHGNMFVQPGNRVQFCAHQTHDGIWERGGKTPQTPAFWPYHHFEAAVEAYRGDHPA